MGILHQVLQCLSGLIQFKSPPFANKIGNVRGQGREIEFERNPFLFLVIQSRQLRTLVRDIP